MKPSLLTPLLFALVGGIFLAPGIRAGDYGLPGKNAKDVLPEPPVETGFYFEGFGGALFLDDLTGHGSADVNAGFDTGWFAGGAIGYEVTPNLSLEIEGATGEGDLDSLSINGTPMPTFRGDLDYSQVAANLIYEFGPQNRITPYLGVGLGAGFADASFVYPGNRISDDDGAFLYQFIGGVTIDLGPRSEFFAEYRYGSLDEFTLQRAGGGVTFDDLDSHQALVGVSIEF